jgi:hypothetical protein
VLVELEKQPNRQISMDVFCIEGCQENTHAMVVCGIYSTLLIH